MVLKPSTPGSVTWYKTFPSCWPNKKHKPFCSPKSKYPHSNVRAYHAIVSPYWRKYKFPYLPVTQYCECVRESECFTIYSAFFKLLVFLKNEMKMKFHCVFKLAAREGVAFYTPGMPPLLWRQSWSLKQRLFPWSISSLSPDLLCLQRMVTSWS